MPSRGWLYTLASYLSLVQIEQGFERLRGSANRQVFFYLLIRVGAHLRGLIEKGLCYFVDLCQTVLPL